MGGKRYKDLESEWIRLYDEEGLNFSQIAKIYKVRIETISDYIRDKVTVKTKSPYKNKYEEWWKHYNEGWGYSEIAKKYSASEYAVKKAVYQKLEPIIEELKWNWISLYKKGYSLKRIGEVYNIHPKIVKNTIEDDMNLQREKRNIYTHLLNDWIQLYKDGYSFEKIAEKFDVSANTVYKNISDKVEVRRRAETNQIEEWFPKWKELYSKNNLTLKEIANKYNVSISTVSKYIRR